MRTFAPRLAVGLSQMLWLCLAGCGGGYSGSGMQMPPPTDTTAPTVPQGVTATAQSSSSILISWTAATDTETGVAGYRVFRDGGATAIANVMAPATSYTDTGLTAATAYSYTVAAFDGASRPNVSAVSTAASATTNATTPPPPMALNVQRVFANLPNFNQPVAMLQAPGNATRWYVVEKTGTVRMFDNTANVASSTVFINIASKLDSDPSNISDERGLLGMAFHPSYPTNPRVYLFYTGTSTTLGAVDRVSEFRTLDGGATLSPGTELELLNVDDPETNHNGGNLVFGPDAMLYIGIGDGGGGGDAHGGATGIGNGQLLTTLLGKLLRIDVTNAPAGQPYGIPQSNPFATNARCTGGTGAANCPEIYAYGLRNPWRWSFDRGSGQLWLNDVGQGAIEEVDLVTLGGNYGWRCFEGTNPFNAQCGPNAAISVPPVAQYGHGATTFSTTGGFVYRGTAIAGLQGRYVFGDFGGRLWHIARDTVPTVMLAAGSGQATGLGISSFAEGVDGELYIVNLGNAVNTGTLHKIVP